MRTGPLPTATVASMKLATLRTGPSTVAVRVDDDGATLVETGFADVGELLSQPDWRARAVSASGPAHDGAMAVLAQLVTRPEKTICVGLNYRSHVLEMGRSVPEFPTLFAKFTRALVGPTDNIVLPPVSTQVDWEVELCVVIGEAVRNADIATARRAIAGFTVANDVSVRDWQNRTIQFLQGKTFEATTPVGPVLVVDEERSGEFAADVTCEVNGEVVQNGHTDDLIFDPVTLVQYCSQIITLMPGDLILTGTPGGVGHACTPPRYLSRGDVLVTRIDGIGECVNNVV